MIRIGVIGCDGRGFLADLAHRPEEGFEVVAAADPNPVSIERFQKKYGASAFVTDDYRELLKQDIDTVFIISPDRFHEEHAVAALEAGKSIYLEKPIALSIEACDNILTTAYKTGSKLFVGHNMRHFPVILKMKEMIEAGAIGELQAVWCRHFVSYGGDAYYKDWHSEREKQVGLLLQKGAHDIDVIHWLANSITTRVVGMGRLSVWDKPERRKPEEPYTGLNWTVKNWPPEKTKGLSPKIDVEDHNMIMMQLENGIQASYTQCFYTPDCVRNYTFIGNRGRLENLGDDSSCDIILYNKRSDQAGKPDQTFHITPEEGTHGGADPCIVDEFLAFIRDDIPTNTSPIAARNAVATGVQATHSLRNGNMPYEVPQLDPAIVSYFENGQKR